MANTLIPKRSSVAGKVPLSTDLQVGEIAVNLADGLIFTKNASGTVISLGGSALTSSSITTALGYTPANKAGDTFTGNVLVSSGAVGVNTTFLNNYLFRIGGNISGATTRGAGEINVTAQADVTAEARGLVSTVSTAAASFTLGQASSFFASQGTIGAGSTITTQVGYLVSSNFTGGTNNYGFRGAIASGANRFNLYMDGTADNYLAGNTGIGGTPATNARLRVVGSGASSEVVRIEGGTTGAMLIVNQTDAPGVNSLRSELSLRKNNVIGGRISVDMDATGRGIVYYDASGATGQHAFYINSTEALRLNVYGALSFAGAGYGTAGQLLRSGGASGAAFWGDISSLDVTTALGFTPQAALVSGTNIKTINGVSVLGSGDITISASGGGASLDDVIALSIALG